MVCNKNGQKKSNLNKEKRIKLVYVMKEAMEKYNEKKFSHWESYKNVLCRPKRNLLAYEPERKFFFSYLEEYAPQDIQAFKKAIKNGKGYINN